MKSLVLLLCFLPVFGIAQYHLGESGPYLGAVASPPDDMKGSYGGQAGAFYSRFICGKSYGYHFSGGVRMQYPNYKGIFGSSKSFGLGDVAAYFKLRQKNYHRMQEVNFLLGARGSFKFLSPDNQPGYAQYSYSKSTFSLDGAVLFRMPLYDQAFFISPGILFTPSAPSNIYFTYPNGETYYIEGGKFSLYVNVMITLWNTKTGSKFR